MARSDVSYTVRAAALHVWKTVVTNTPRTLAEVLPALMANIIASLAAPGDAGLQSMNTNDMAVIFAMHLSQRLTLTLPYR